MCEAFLTCFVLMFIFFPFPFFLQFSLVAWCPSIHDDDAALGAARSARCILPAGLCAAAVDCLGPTHSDRGASHIAPTTHKDQPERRRVCVCVISELIWITSVHMSFVI